MQTYEPTVNGVQAFVPHAHLSATSEPSLASVSETFLPAADSEVALAIGRTEHLDDDIVAIVSRRARHLVEKKAAVDVLIAQSPEAALKAGSYAMTLLTQFEKEKLELAELVARGGNVPERGAIVPTMGVAWTPPIDPNLTEQEIFLDPPFGIPPAIAVLPLELGEDAGFPL